MKTVRVNVVQMKAAIKEAAASRSSDEDFSGLIEELRAELQQFERAAESEKAAEAEESFRRLSGGHCNRCHFKMRWGMSDEAP